MTCKSLPSVGRRPSIFVLCDMLSGRAFDELDATYRSVDALERASPAHRTSETEGAPSCLVSSVGERGIRARTQYLVEAFLRERERERERERPWSVVALRRCHVADEVGAGRLFCQRFSTRPASSDILVGFGKSGCRRVLRLSRRVYDLESSIQGKPYGPRSRECV